MHSCRGAKQEDPLTRPPPLLFLSKHLRSVPVPLWACCCCCCCHYRELANCVMHPKMNGMRTLSTRRSVMWRNCRDLWSCYAAVSVAALGRPVLSNPLNCDWATNVRGNSTSWSTVPSCAPSCVCMCVCVRRLKLIPKCFKLLFIFCCWFVFAHFVYCVFSFSLPVLCTHHKFGFLYFEYFTILHKYFKTSHSARTTHARLA